MTATRVNPAQLSAFGNGKIKGGLKEPENGWKNKLEEWSGDRERCGQTWSPNSWDMGMFSSGRL